MTSASFSTRIVTAELRQDFRLSRLTALKSRPYISLTFARFPS